MNDPEAVLLRAQNIWKAFDGTVALTDVSVDFAAHTICGLFGRNGAGKTTLLNILSGRSFADSGQVTCMGGPGEWGPEQRMSEYCYLPERNYLPGRLRVSRLLELAEGMFPYYRRNEAERLADVFELDTDKRYENLSRGHQSIFRIVVGLASNAPITIFDEPVLGLDALARDRFYAELIEAYTRNPRLFIISTHFIDESVDLFNEVIIVQEGAVLRKAPVEELMHSAFYVTGSRYRVEPFIEDRTVLDIQQVNEMMTVVVAGDLDTQEPVHGLRFSPVSVQKLFIHLTGGSAREEMRQ